MSRLPRIACFHGGGSSAAIFKVQCEKLQQYLSTTYEFVFFNAPFIRDAGPGVLPYFAYEEYGPYRTWFSTGEDGEPIPDGSGKGVEEGGVARVLKMLRDEGEGGEWVGCMGFSQGTRVVGGLLLEQQRRKQMGWWGAAGESIDFKFGVLCMGSSAPMTSGTEIWQGTELISIPTLHVHGLKDKQYEPGKKQWEGYFEQSKTTVWDVDYHHAMPWTRKDVEHLVMLMKGMKKYI